ncbi:hypothetical protein AOY38_03755 [Synechocystis sp. PCC 6803]|nr:hypothetical protein AOY38_03755 [Synechocystis sp. PCC 6803]
MILFHILGPKQSLLGPKISISSVLISFYNEQGRGLNFVSLDVATSGRDRLILAAFNIKLRNKLQNLTTFLTTTTLPFAFTCQPSYLLFQLYAVMIVTKAVPIISGLILNIKPLKPLRR